MRSKSSFGLVIAAALLAVAPAASVRAHHGGGIEWGEELEGPMTGIATEFAFRFPHVLLYMDVDNGGTIENWAITTRWTPTILREHDWSRSSVKPGDTVEVTFRRHVSNPRVAQMQTIEVNGHQLPLDF
jgi:hypothetical protein